MTSISFSTFYDITACIAHSGWGEWHIVLFSTIRLEKIKDITKQQGSLNGNNLFEMVINWAGINTDRFKQAGKESNYPT